ncbi:unnamed protein product [Penicillium bialowiezense]
MAISQKTNQAIKEKLVQFANHNQPTCTEFTNEPKSQQNAALQEALQCTECNMGITPKKMQSDIANGIYSTARYPPYFTNKLAPVEEISPLDTSPRQPRDFTFWSDITDAQQHKYFEAVDAVIRRAEATIGQAASEAVVVYAHYHVDSHIRQHYMRTQSVLNLCRDRQEVIDLNHWQWETAASEETADVDNEEWGVGWASDLTNSLNEQYNEWKTRQSQRDDHLAFVKSQWIQIQREREEQRKKTFVFLYRGVPIRSIRYTPAPEPPLEEEEIMDLAYEAAYYEAAFDEDADPQIEPL